ncbi:N-6 DNA methylase [Brachybacterium sp. AG952]|uniref:N-6 DNA methylase n=1 Tax=Brachybacterium sp. AG952 TaxID=2183989 RepID=UPI00105EFBA8|nr:N-6 DNA methylase [Brachybacterium sp. AG952]TDP73624.1 N-6 DNA methylase [Brachybacterium sp. AG952]
MATDFASDAPPRSFSASAVTRVVHDLQANTKSASRANWLRAVATVTTTKRSDLANGLIEILGAEPFSDGSNPLEGLTVGEIGVCYEALLALMDSRGRRASGQYFTPDDAARFMAERSTEFPEGVWLDPCCGVGNLAWHLAAVQPDSATFVRDRLALIDLDQTALVTAVALLGAGYLAHGDLDGLAALHERAEKRDFLAQRALPRHDFVIVNPPYARAPEKPGMRTGRTRELFSYFLERIATESSGFIAVTPASYLSAPKFNPLRDVLDKEVTGGDIFVFDNVPDTLFRGYKFGSSNTSSTNFVRAAITVCAPERDAWAVTPIIRWKTANRARMFAMAPDLLAARKIGPADEWVKLPSALAELWDRLSSAPLRLKHLVVPEITEYSLTIGMTPRYYISAAYRDLERGSKAVLHFRTAEDRDRAALVLNSSVPYLWWRALDGGVTLPRRVLFSTPIPASCRIDAELAALVMELKATEGASITTKLNAGIINENVKRPIALVERINQALLGDVPDLHIVYSEDMAADY